MRSNSALYVDVGYLLASAATRTTGTSFRNGIVVDYGALIRGLIAQVEEDSGLPLLRVNWYDSGGRPGGQADHDQEQIGIQPKVKLRLGRRSPSGDQKGVDVRLGLDLATHGRNRVVDVMYLLSGDDDLAEAVEEAQGHGVQVILLAVPGSEGRAHGVAQHLLREADGLALIGTDILDATVRKPMKPETRGAPEEPAPGPPPGEVDVAVEAPAKHAPTPADLMGKRVAVPVPQAVARTSSTLAWSSETGRAPVAPSSPDDPGLADVIDEVCRNVLSTWRASATEADVVALRAGRPQIPTAVDRTLLVDLSTAVGVYDLDEGTRYALRDHFWKVVDRGTV